jgi:hypothetical protein
MAVSHRQRSVLQGFYFTEEGSGTLTLSGSATSTWGHSDTGSGSLTLSGSQSESRSASNSASGTLTLSGSATESDRQTEPGSGTFTLSGTATSAGGRSDTGSGTLTLTALGPLLLPSEELFPSSELFPGATTNPDRRTGEDAPSGTFTLSTETAEEVRYIDAAEGTLTLLGVVEEARVDSSVSAAALSLEGVGLDHWERENESAGAGLLELSGSSTDLYLLFDEQGAVVGLSGFGEDTTIFEDESSVVLLLLGRSHLYGMELIDQGRDGRLESGSPGIAHRGRIGDPEWAI